MLFRVKRAGTISTSCGTAKKKAIQHFWLCPKCTESMTLGFDSCKKVTVIPVIPVLSADGATASQ
jgi:predicted RNA-binding Zn-ribbon protein involved in translation (DUF1610 family)